MSTHSTISITISSEHRNKIKYPRPDKYCIDLPIPVQRVRQVSLGSIELPVNNDAIPDFAAGIIPISQGLVAPPPTRRDDTIDALTESSASDSACCPDDGLCSNVITVCEETGGRADIALPCTQQAATSLPSEVSADLVNGEYETACPHGLHCNPIPITVVYDSITAQLPPCSITATSCTTFTVDPGALDPAPSGDIHLAVCALTITDMMQVLEAQLQCGAPHTLKNRYKVALDANGNVIFEAMGDALSFQVSAGSWAQQSLGLSPPILYSCMHCDIPSSDIPCRYGAASTTPPPVSLASVPPGGSLNPSALANHMMNALNPLMFQSPQKMVVRRPDTTMVMVQIRPGMYTRRLLAAELQGALSAALGEPVRFRWSAAERRFTASAERRWSLCLQVPDLNNESLLSALGLHPVEYSGGTRYRGDVVHSTFEPRHVYKVMSSVNPHIKKGYSISAAEYVIGEASVNMPAMDVSRVGTLQDAESYFRQAVGSVEIDVSVIASCPNGTYILSNKANTHQVDHILRVHSARTNQEWIVRVVEGEGFGMCVDILGGDPVEDVETVRIMSAFPPRFELPFQTKRYPMVQRMGFHNKLYRPEQLHTSDQSWNCNSNPFIIMNLGIPDFGTPNKFYRSPSTFEFPDGKLVPIFTAIGTGAASESLSRQYQDSPEFKTSGSVNVGQICVEFLDKYLQPYDFKDCEHMMSLVFIVETDQAILSCQ